MKEKELKDLLSKRLYIELQLFKYAILRQTKEEIYRGSFKIEAIEHAYEILQENMENIDEDTVCVLLYQDFSVLEFLCQEWMSREDSVFGGFREYIKNRLETITQIKDTVSEKEGEDGAEFNKAA